METTRRALAPVLLLLGAAALTLGLAAPASAAASAPTGETITARVITKDGDGVAGADVDVAQGERSVATGTTDASGAVSIDVPEAGDDTVTLDEEGLPAASQGLLPQKNPIATTVNAGTPRTVAFRLTEDGGAAAAGSSFLGINWSLAPQLFATGLRFGLVIALAAIGLSLIFGTTGLTNFAHGELITYGALVTYLLASVVGLPFLLAAALGLVLSAAFGWVNDRALWQPLRRRGTGLIAMMIVSIGLSLLLRYFYLYVFGGGTRFFPAYNGQGPVNLFGGAVKLRPLDLVTMGLSVVVLVAVAFALLRTRLGKAARAVADNPALASASGIDVDRVIRTVWIGGSALAGLSGIILGLQQGMNYLMGFQLLLLVFAAVTLGGLGTAFGAILGSIIVGVFVQVSTLKVPTELANVGALVILIVILLVRPQGILGRAQRVG